MLEDHVVRTHKVPSEEWCQGYCIRDHRCRTFNCQIKVDPTDTGHQCDVNYYTKKRHPGFMKKRPGWVHYEVSERILVSISEKKTKIKIFRAMCLDNLITYLG